MSDKSTHATEQNQRSTRFIDYGKIGASLFLGFLALLLLLFAFALSNPGLRSIAHFANSVDTLDIRGIEGSFYSKVNIQSINVAVKDSADISLSNTHLDTNLSCLFDFAVCVEHLSAEQVAIDIKDAEELAEAEQAQAKLIQLPLPIVLKHLSIEHLILTRNKANTKVLEIRGAQLQDFRALTEFKLAQLGVSQILIFQDDSESSTKPTGASPSATSSANSKSSSMPFSLSALKAQLENAPLVVIPEIFIPLEFSLGAVDVQSLCWGLAQTQDISVEKLSSDTHAQCVGLSSEKLVHKGQILSLLSRLRAKALFREMALNANILDVQAEVDFDSDYAHELQLMLSTAQSGATLNDGKADYPYLKVVSSGDINDLALSAKVNEEDLGQSSVKVKWQERALPIELELRSASIARLNPMLIKPLLGDIYDLSLQVNGDWQSYRAQFQSNISTEGLASNKALEAINSSMLTFAGELSPAQAYAQINTLKGAGALGEFNIEGKVDIRALSNELALASNLNIELNDLNLGALDIRPALAEQASADTTELTSRISGDFRLVHLLSDQWMQADLACDDIKGTLMGERLALNCDISLSKAGLLSIKALDFIQGEHDNYLKAKGSLALASSDYQNLNVDELLEATADLSFDIDFKHIQAVLPSVRGNVYLDGSLQGKLGAPEASIEGRIGTLSHESFGIERGSLTLDIDAQNGYATSARLELAELAYAGGLINRTLLEIEGDLNSHQLKVDLLSPQFNTIQRLSGGLEDGATLEKWVWDGQWNSGQVVLPFAVLNLEDAFEMSISSSTVETAASPLLRANADEHCWISQDQDSICLSDLTFVSPSSPSSASNAPKSAVAMQSSASLNIDYDLASIARYYIPDLVLTDTHIPLNTQGEFAYSAQQGLEAKVYSTVLNAKVETNEHMLDLSAIVANMRLQDNLLSSNIFAGTEQTGTLGFQSNLALNPDAREHSGKLRIDGFDLSLLQRFARSVESMLGVVNANIDFSGELTKPQLDGVLNVSSGELILDAYIYPLTDFEHNMQFAGETATMQGSFMLGDGSAQYKAKLFANEGLNIEGELKGEKMQFAFSDSTAKVSPDLTFTMSPRELILNGKLTIPEAALKISELPENARTPSPDTIVIGREPPPPVVPLAMDIDLNIIIDEAKRGFVTVDALDLEASLAGNLDLSVVQKRSRNSDDLQPLRTILNGQVNVLSGNYEAYGQKLVVQSGKILFNGEPTLPQFNIRAIRNPLNTNGDVVAGIHLTGNPVVPRVELFSEPPMTQAKQLSYLLQGRDITAGGDSGSGGSNALLMNALVSYGVGQSEGGIGQLGQALGFDSLNLQTAGAGTSSQVQISGRISEDIQITYGIGLFDQASEVILKYQIMPQLFIEAKSGADSAVDLFYEFSRGIYSNQKPEQASTKD